MEINLCDNLYNEKTITVNLDLNSIESLPDVIIVKNYNNNDFKCYQAVRYNLGMGDISHYERCKNICILEPRNNFFNRQISTKQITFLRSFLLLLTIYICSWVNLFLFNSTFPAIFNLHKINYDQSIKMVCFYCFLVLLPHIFVFVNKLGDK